MRPLALMTLNQGTRCDEGVCRNTVPTSRARRGNPATSATLPYVETLPRGIRLTVAMIRAASLSGAITMPRLGARCRVARAAVFLAALRPACLRLLDWLRTALLVSDRHPIVHRFLRAVGAVGIAAAFATGQGNPERCHEGHDALHEIAGRIGQQMEQQ